MLTHKLAENGCSFFVEDKKKEPIKISDWNISASKLFFDQCIILNELVDNGLAAITDNDIVVEYTQLLKLSCEELTKLRLPKFYPYFLYIQAYSTLNRNDFKYRLSFRKSAPLGDNLAPEHIGALIKANNGFNYLLTETQFLVCEKIKIYNQLSEDFKKYENNLMFFSSLKELCLTENKIELDSYLKNEHIHFPETIKLETKYNEGQLQILPYLFEGDDEKNSLFVQSFDRFDNVQRIFQVQTDDRKTTRIVLKEELNAQLAIVKAQRFINKEEAIHQLIENPAAYFDAEFVDFSVFFSDRVIEWGIYKPKFYPFVSPYKNEWIPGICIQSKINGEKRILFKTEDELKKFKDAYTSSKNNNDVTLKWEDENIPLSEAAICILIAEMQLKNPKKPIVQKTDDEIEGKKVLIIKDNTDTTEYIIEGDKITFRNLSFLPIENLKPNFSLKEHQKEGVAWMQSLIQKGNAGCLLADDMGLGKTLQILYFLEWHNQNLNKQADLPYLIIAPLSLLENWKKEYNDFFGNKTLRVKQLKSSDLKKSVDKASVKEFQNNYKNHLLICSYETVRTYQLFISAINIAVVVLDEAQKIKTIGTLITNACKALKTDFRIAVTGTPVENSLMELWSIMDFCVPGLLKNAKDFSKKYQNVLKSENADLNQLGQSLRHEIGAYLLRRLKKDVATELKEKHIYYKENEMPPIQFETYLEAIRGHASNEYKKLVLIHKIRDISNHPFLATGFDEEAIEDIINNSARLTITIDIINSIKKKQEKVIVFCERKEMQRLLCQVFYHNYGFRSSIINGETSANSNDSESRQKTIEKFVSVEGFNIIIMSQLSAGVGLNVQGANHVIHYSRHWNPAKEAQATDRAYRIGQKKEVHVYYPIAILRDKNGPSFDQALNSLLERKSKLSENTMFPTEKMTINEDELFNELGIN